LEKHDHHRAQAPVTGHGHVNRSAEYCLPFGLVIAAFLAPCHAFDPPGRPIVEQGMETHWAFVLSRNAIASAGVYDDQGRLLRTLWRGESLPAGPVVRTWDGLDDHGKPVGPGRVEFRLVQHRVRAVWEGVIGNSSASLGDSKVHRSFFTTSSFQPVGSRMFYVVGYNEFQPGLHAFDLATPQIHLLPFERTGDAFVSYAMLASDGARLYWANASGVSRNSFVGALQLDTSKRAGFSAGQQVCLNLRPGTQDCYLDQLYESVINLRTEADDIPTGLAVQRQGKLLAVAHGGRNLIRLFDKTSGAAIKEFAVPLTSKAVNQLAMTPAGDLWVVSGSRVLRYAELSGQPSVAAAIGELVKPLAVATAESGDEGVWVADGGASQQIKKFDRAGRLERVIGLKGGYATDPSVAPDKLCFAAEEGREQTAIGVPSDGSVWVVDRCNNRTLRFPLKAHDPLQSDAQIAYLPAVYTNTVDLGNPRRVFANFLEFEVERDVALTPGKGWKLVRNWLAGMPRGLIDDRAMNRGFGGFSSVVTLANGRTFGLLAAQGRQHIVELSASGPLRIVKTFAQPMPGTTARALYENGDLGYSLTGPTTQSAMRLPLTGFDAAGDPVWSSEPVKLASVPKLPGSPWYRGAFSGMPPRFPLTASGNVVFFDQAVEGNEGFHLGAAKLGSTEWLWQASPTGALDGKGSFQTKQIDGSVQYGGNVVWTFGRHIIYGYHGEFYKDMRTGGVGQANQFMHFDESGLFIGQFGAMSTRPAPPNLAGLSGNAFSPTLVHDGKNLYLYHNDESTHGGIHRWRIDGWDDVNEMRGSGPVGGTIELR
jgi:hypothetical protein